MLTGYGWNVGRKSHGMTCSRIFFIMARSSTHPLFSCLPGLVWSKCRMMSLMRFLRFNSKNLRIVGMYGLHSAT